MSLHGSSKNRTPTCTSTDWIAARILSADVPRISSSAPPAAAIGVFSCVICSASSATPSANRELCETMTKPTAMGIASYQVGNKTHSSNHTHFLEEKD